jgi:hypothetical protein
MRCQSITYGHTLSCGQTTTDAHQNLALRQRLATLTRMMTPRLSLARADAGPKMTIRNRWLRSVLSVSLASVVACAAPQGGDTLSGNAPDASVAPPPRPVSELPEVAPVREPRHALHHVFSQLQRIDSGQQNAQVSVLHMGASHTASDTVTGPLRVAFSDRFGQAGRGFIQPGVPWRRFRQLSAAHDMQGEWTVHHGMQRDAVHPFGIGGVRIESVEAGAWFSRGTCEGCQVGQEMSGFVVHYVRQVGGGSFRVYVDEQLSTTIYTGLPLDTHAEPGQHFAEEFSEVDQIDLQARTELPAELLEGEVPLVELPEPGNLQETRIEDVEPVVHRPGYYEEQVTRGPHQLRFEVVGDGPVAFTGVTTTLQQSGVRYSSIGLNGSQGGHFLGFDEVLSVGDLEYISPDLVIFAWGINETYSDRYYPEDLNAPPEEWMERVQRHRRIYVDLMTRIRQVKPEASCILLLPTDINPDRHPARAPGAPRCSASPETGIDREACAQALPRVHPYIRQAQIQAAEELNCAVWDQQHAMGGPGGMALWAALEPPLAGSDGIHLSATGYSRLAEGFFRDFMNAWELWLLEPSPEVPFETSVIEVLPRPEGSDAVASRPLWFQTAPLEGEAQLWQPPSMESHDLHGFNDMPAGDGMNSWRSGPTIAVPAGRDTGNPLF